MKRIPIDLYKKYNSWTILEIVKNPKGDKFRCKCDCGTESLITGTDLRKNRSKQCIKCAGKVTSKRLGVDLTNKKFGKWIALKKIGTTKYRRPIWLCRCECGRIGEIPSGNLLSGLSTKCGLCNHYIGIKGRVWAHILSGARSRNINFSLSLKYVWELFLAQEGKCILTGVQITLPSCSKDTYTASLDRIDNTQGYIEGNVQWVHKLVNRMKHVMNNKEFITICHNVTNIYNINPKTNWIETAYFKSGSKKNKNYNTGITSPN